MEIIRKSKLSTSDNAILERLNDKSFNLQYSEFLFAVNLHFQKYGK